MRRLGGLLLALALAGCGSKPEPANPALWQIEGPRGETGWLFGTIHSLPGPAKWRSREVERALDRADRVVVEVDNLADDAAMARIFARLARSPGHPPLSRRIRPDLRDELDVLLERGRMKQGQFGSTETWAAALILARIGQDALDGKHGVDRAVIESAGEKPVIALEGAEGQLAIFDALPESEQRDLLNAVVGDAAGLETDSARLAETWRRGDMAAIEEETRGGLLADPELRQALFTGRNRIWVAEVVAMLERGERPFVAVGAAHMAGPEGLPALLEAEGFKVTRVQ